MTQRCEAPPGEPRRLLTADNGGSAGLKTQASRERLAASGAAVSAVSRGPVLAEGYDALDANGSVVHLRPVTGSDGPQLKALCQRMSPRSRYQRFLGASGVAAEQYLARVSTGDLTLDAVVALRRGTITGLGSTHPMPGRRAEFALLVDDAVHAAGVGTLLAEDLVARSLARGVNELCAEVLRTNAQVLDLLQHLGLPMALASYDDSLSVRLDLRDLHAYRLTLARRELSSRARSVSAEPGGVATHPPAAVVATPAGRLLAHSTRFETDGSDPAVAAILREVRHL